MKNATAVENKDTAGPNKKNEQDRKMITIDGNTAVAQVAHGTNEVIAIYPTTPSSPFQAPRRSSSESRWMR